MITKVLSGGQVGVELAALRAARACGLETGGWAAHGWLTEDDATPWLADFGLLGCPEADPEACRRLILDEADTLVLIGDQKAPGAVALQKDWAKLRMSAAFIWVEPGASTPREVAGFLRQARRGGQRVKSVMVAGDSELSHPGISERTERFLVAVFRLLADGQAPCPTCPRSRIEWRT